VIALIYRNYWSLIIGSLSLNVCETILSYYYCTYRPKITLCKLKKQWDFTKWLFAANITSFLRNQSMYFIIPKFISTGALGNYSMAYHLANMLYEQLIEPIAQPIYASYAKVKHNKVEFSLVIIKVISIISIILLPTYTSLFILSEHIILIFLGEKWGHIQNIFDILLFFVFFQAYIFIISNVLMSKGYVKLLAILNWCLVIILIPLLLYCAIQYNLEYLVIARTCLSLTFFFTFIFIFYKLVWLDWNLMLNSLVRILISTACMSVFLYFIVKTFNHINFLLIIIPLISICVILYSLIIILLWLLAKKPPGGELFILEELSSVFDKISAFQFISYRINKIIK